MMHDSVLLLVLVPYKYDWSPKTVSTRDGHHFISHQIAEIIFFYENEFSNIHFANILFGS